MKLQKNGKDFPKEQAPECEGRRVAEEEKSGNARRKNWLKFKGRHAMILGPTTTIPETWTHKKKKKKTTVMVARIGSVHRTPLVIPRVPFAGKTNSVPVMLPGVGEKWPRNTTKLSLLVP